MAGAAAAQHMLALISGLVLSTLAAAEAPALAPTPGAPATCDPTAVDAALRDLESQRRFSDVHQVAQAAAIFCAGGSRPGWLLVDAVALTELGDSLRALDLVADVAASAPPPLAARAQVLKAWIAFRQRDQVAVAQALTAAPVDARPRLCLLINAEAPGFADARDDCPARRSVVPLGARALLDDLRAAQVTRRPWVGGVLSAVLPGAGQVYGGSWQGAAVAFFLNTLAIGATVDLARHKLYGAASLTGFAASVVYVGNIINAVDLAERRNDVAAAPPTAALEHLLLPERFVGSSR